MLTSVISASDQFQTVAQSAQNKFQQIQTLFQKIGQDLQSNNLTQAKSDFLALSHDLPNFQQSANSGTTGPASTLAKTLQALGQDISAGNLTAAQQDFAAIQQNAQQQQSTQLQGHHHHRIVDSSQQSVALRQNFSILGQSLQSGNLPSARQAYAVLQSDLQQDLPTFTAAPGGVIPSTSSTGSVNVAA
jgi:hypothetical protein